MVRFQVRVNLTLTQPTLWTMKEKTLEKLVEDPRKVSKHLGSIMSLKIHLLDLYFDFMKLLLQWSNISVQVESAEAGWFLSDCDQRSSFCSLNTYIDTLMCLCIALLAYIEQNSTSNQTLQSNIVFLGEIH